MDNLYAAPIITNMIERRSIRKYLPQPVEREKLLSVLMAACYAPSGHNNQSWHFTAITNSQVLEKLRVLVRDGFRAADVTKNSHMAAAVNAAQRDDYCFHYNAPCLIVVSNKKDYLNAMADCSCALENMMLAANALGLGSCWVNQIHWQDDNEELRKFLAGYGVPSEHTICGSVIIGYSAYDRTPTALPRRKGCWNIVE